MIASRRALATEILLAAVLILTACGPNWQPVSVLRPQRLDEGKVLEFHAKGELVRLHAVRFEKDSISGIPWLEHVTCDPCRQRFALADVSDARTGDPGAGAWTILVPMMLVLAFLYSLRNAFPYT
jgi:hypothetical protein